MIRQGAKFAKDAILQSLHGALAALAARNLRPRYALGTGLTLLPAAQFVRILPAARCQLPAVLRTGILPAARCPLPAASCPLPAVPSMGLLPAARCQLD